MSREARLYAEPVGASVQPLYAHPAPMQCYEVKAGYKLQTFKDWGTGYFRVDAPLSDALILRSVEDVRREAFEEAAAIELDMEVHLHDGRIAHRETVGAYRAAIRRIAEKS